MLAIMTMTGTLWAQFPAQHGAPASNGILEFDAQALMQRLQAAEARLHELEVRRLPSVESDRGTSAFKAGFGNVTDDTIQRLEAVEKTLKKQADDAAKKKADDAKKPTQKWSGRIHWDYWNFPTSDALTNAYETGSPTDNPEDRFTFRRVRFGVAGDILENMTYKIEMEFAIPNEPAFKDVYIGWKELPVLQTVLLGNQKRPYGLDHLNSSRYNVFMERPFIIEAVNQDARRFGLCSYGLSDDLAWNWRYGAFLMQDIQGLGDYTSNDYQMEVAGRLANTIWYDEASDGRGYAHWAVAGTYADPSATVDGNAVNQGRFRTRPEARTVERWFDTGAIANAQKYEMAAVEGVINVGALQIVGEYQHVWFQRHVGPELQFDGGYVYVAYFLTGEHTPWERESGTLGRVKPFENFFLVERCCGGRGWGMGAWQVAARYSHGDFTDEDIFGGTGDSITLGMNWWWTPYSRLQFNYIHGSVKDGKRATNLGTPAVTVIPAGASGDYDIYGARFMVDF